jgi:hypothetical protein
MKRLKLAALLLCIGATLPTQAKPLLCPPADAIDPPPQGEWLRQYRGTFERVFVYTFSTTESLRRT